ncbi:MAG: hypothetical protein Q9225_003684 [Loekoesia sp. 1 TL-2023]
MTTKPPNDLFTNPTIKSFLLTLAFRTAYTSSQILAILAHKFTTSIGLEEMQNALARWDDERDEVYLKAREMGKVEYIWVERGEIEEAEGIEEVLKKEGRWPE